MEITSSSSLTDRRVVLKRATASGAQTTLRGTLFCTSPNDGSYVVLLTGDPQQKAYLVQSDRVKSIVEEQTKETNKRFKFLAMNQDQPQVAAPSGIPAEAWRRRYFLFSKFDEGIRMDAESWYSVTPEPIAQHIAERCRCNLILDACCGAGGNAIHFAQTCNHVIACEVSPERIMLAQANARIYRVDDRIEFLLGNVMDFMKSLPADSVDVVFLSPPWGGPEYKHTSGFSLADQVTLYGPAQSTHHDGIDLFIEARRVARLGVAYYLPRTCSLASLHRELGVLPTEFERHHVWNTSSTFTVCCYFGDFGPGD